MAQRARTHLRSNAVAYLALFFALGMGTAWAIERNSVRSEHIVNGQVKRTDQAKDQRTDWALIHLGLEPRIIRQSGGISITHPGGHTNATFLDFGHSVAGRALSATPLQYDDVGVAATMCGGGAVGMACEYPETENRRHVYVQSDAARVYVAVLPR